MCILIGVAGEDRQPARERLLRRQTHETGTMTNEMPTEIAAIAKKAPSKRTKAMRSADKRSEPEGSRERQIA